MANIKVSQMTAATALTGAELIPIVQSGVNKTATINMFLQLPIIVAGKTRAIKYVDSSDIVVRIDIYNDSSLADYSDGSVEGSIQWAVNTLGNNGGLVSISNGIYPIAASILIDWDWITIQGVSDPFWIGPGTAYPAHQLPGTPGGAQIVATTAINMFTIGDTAANMHGAIRHKGITIKKIYGYGSYVALSFIISKTWDQTHDVIHITENMIQGFTEYAIIGAWDANYIEGNQIQSNIGGGILRQGGFTGWIINNVIYDNGGAAIEVTAGVNNVIYGNIVGSGVIGTTPVEIILSGGSGVVFGNVHFDNSPPISKTGGDWLIYGNYGGNELTDTFKVTGDTKVVGNTLVVGDTLVTGLSKTALSYNTGIMTSNAMGADLGGKLSLGGRYSTTDVGYTPFGSIVGRKENATDDNGDGYIAFITTNGNDYPYYVEWVKITSKGKVAMGGITTPTAFLHLPAAAAAADKASLKIDAGVVATTPVSGNIESDGTNLYWTDSGGTRRQLNNA